MKKFQLALFALAAIALVGCGPSNPPSQSDGYSLGTPDNSGLGDINGGLAERDLKAGADASHLFNQMTGRYDPASIMSTIYFGFDQYGVESGERGKLSAIADKAKNTKLIVAGYTDHFGTDQYNLGLSDKRAQSVKDYLVKLGVPEDSIQIQAYGKHYAKPAGSKSEVREDRRVDVVNANYGK